MRYVILRKRKNELKRLSRLGVIVMAIILAWLSPLNPFRISRVSAAEATVDGTVASSNNSNAFRNGGRRQVFISDQVGYIFYQDSDDTCSYSKSTDGGATWGAAVTVDAQTDCVDPSIWYDRWTPGDNTGTNIYIVTFDPGNDDLWYNVLDTSSDTLANGSSPVAITSLPGPDKTNTLTAGNPHPPIVKGTDGVLYTGVQDSSGSYVIKCSTACSTASNWSDAGTIPLAANDNDTFTLIPTLGGKIMAIRLSVTTNNRESVIWNGTAWSASWTVIMTTGGEQSANQAYVNAAVNRSTGDIYFVTVSDNATFGTDDDIKTAVYSYSSGTWSTKADVVTDSGVASGAVCAGVTGTGSGTGCGIIGAQLAIDDNTGDIYCVYAARTTAGSGTSVDVYWTKSTNGMTSWGTHTGPLNSAPINISGINVNEASNERLYVSWNDNSAFTLIGNTMADLTPPASNSTFTQSAYHWYSNTDGITPNGSFAAENTAASIPCGVGPLRLRTALTIGTATMAAGSTQFKLQYGTSTSGPWTDVGQTGSNALFSDDFTGTDNSPWDATKWTNEVMPSGGSATIQSNAGRLVTGSGTSNFFIDERANFTAATDQELYTKFRFTAAVGNKASLAINLRYSGATNTNAYTLSIPMDGTSVLLQSSVNGFGGTLNKSALPPVTWTQNTDYALRFRVVGSAIQVRIWLASNSEPSTWLFNYTNTEVTGAGQADFRAGNMATSADTATVTLDDLTISNGSAVVPAAVIGNYDNPSVTDGATLSAAKLSGSPTLESYVESGTTPLNPSSIALSGKGEWDFSLNTAAAPPNTYYFRMVKSDGTVLGTYTVYPTLTITTTPPMDSVMMHGTFFSGEAKQPMACSFMTAPS